MIRNLKLEIRNFSRGFTLIEIVVVLGITISLLVIIGGVITSSFRIKNSGDVLESIQNESQTVMTELKYNVFDANPDFINCSASVGSSISFQTRSGGMTTLKCDEVTSKVASISAESGTYSLNTDGMLVQNCGNFVSCQLIGDRVVEVDFNLKISDFDFVSKVAVR